jgi:serine/threonine protein kinase
MAPEALIRPLSCSDAQLADAWSLGVLYCILTRQQYSWDAAKIYNDQLWAFMDDPFHTLRASLRPSTMEIIGHMLQVDTAKRWTVQEARHAFQSIE